MSKTQEGGASDSHTLRAPEDEINDSLGRQLWAEIAKARAEQESGITDQARSSAASESRGVGGSNSDDGSSIISTITTVLALAASSPHMNASLHSTPVPQCDGKSLYAVLGEIAASGTKTVEPRLAATLADLIVTATSSKKKKKRKREQTADLPNPRPAPAPPITPANGPELPPHHLFPPISELPTSQQQPLPCSEDPPQHAVVADLLGQVGHAISIVHSTLNHSTVHGIPLDHNVVTSIQGPLHHVFLFAATSAVCPDTVNTDVLQEISGLIQILGILHEVIITSATMVNPLARTHQTMYNSGTPVPVRHLQSIQSNFTDIGTAVYPCLYPSCGKTFEKLISLRKHEALHSFDRPFKCPRCTAAFARKYDLKRHEKSHNTVVYQCGGCHRKFTRRDAIRRHKSNVKSGEACAKGEIREVEADVEDIQAATRRVKQVTPPHDQTDDAEDGELSKEAVARTQEAVIILHPLLQRHVTEKLAAAGCAAGTTPSAATAVAANPSLLFGYNLNEEQTNLLQKAIAAASEAARMQAELEAQLELGEGYGDDDEAD